MLKRKAATSELPPPRVGTRSVVIEPPIGPDLEGMPQMGAVLIGSGALSSEQIELALREQTTVGTRLGDLLIQQHVIDDRTLASALSTHFGIPLIDLRTEVPTTDATSLMTEQQVRELGVIPVRVEGLTLLVAVADPTDGRVLAALSNLRIDRVEIHIAPLSEIRAAMNTAYRALVAVDDDVKAFEADRGDSQVVNKQTTATVDENAPIIQVVNKLVTQALRDRASDVHIEPSDEQLRVRFRVDGALHQVLTLPVGMGPALVSRIKIMADMNIVERRRPQDGQFRMVIDGRELDVRVSTTPTIFGEKAVLRLLDKSRTLYRLSDLGMPEDTHERFSRMVRSPFGMLICSGPTGSGKTTTLYATLTEINRSELNVTTIEDPVEYVFPAVNQIQINTQAEVTFANGLRSILRQDPDVILIGEVRDVETARIAVQSALTGHFVLSSLHATDSASAFYRLLDMGVEPFLVASSVIGVVGQRLVRRICSKCIAPATPSDIELEFYRRYAGPPKKDFMAGKGCNICNGTGYYERIGVYEVLEVDDDIRKTVVAGSTPHELRDVAMSKGMRTMRDEGLRLVANDLTTIGEVIRTVYTA